MRPDSRESCLRRELFQGAAADMNIRVEIGGDDAACRWPGHWWPMILMSTGMPGCSAPMLPVIATVPEAADALKLLICSVPSLPVDLGTDVVQRLIPRT